MKYPIRLSTFLIAVAWAATAVIALIDKDYGTVLVAAVSIGYALSVALYLRDLEYAQRRITVVHTKRQPRTEKKDPNP